MYVIIFLILIWKQVILWLIMEKHKVYIQVDCYM